MIYRLTGATVRAIGVAILVMLPTFLLSDTTQSSLEFTRILATIASVFVIYEYGFPTPSVIEFRFAAPYNRVRFLLMVSLILTPPYLIANMLDGNSITGTIATIANNGFAVLDFTYSPVAIVADTLAGSDIAMREAIGQAIALNVIICISFILAFCVSVFANLWRFGGDNFNMWLNMPTYKSYDISSLQRRLENSSFSSLLIACLIPLFGPTIASAALTSFSHEGILSPITISWVIALWIYLPAMYMMRAIALAKIAMGRDDKTQWVPV